MDESRRILMAGVVGILIIVGMVGYLGSSSTGALTSFQGQTGYPVYRDYQEYACGAGETLLLRQETRYGTGKMVIVDCLPAGSVTYAQGNMFPRIGQRWKIPPR